jgi:hypothetical protein
MIFSNGDHPQEYFAKFDNIQDMKIKLLGSLYWLQVVVVIFLQFLFKKMRFIEK